MKYSSVRPTGHNRYACKNDVDHDVLTPWQGQSGSNHDSWINIDLGEIGMMANISKVEIRLDLCHNFQLTTSTAVGCLNDNGIYLPDNKLHFANCGPYDQCEYDYSVSNVRCIKFYCSNKAAWSTLPQMPDFRVFALEEASASPSVIASSTPSSVPSVKVSPAPSSVR